MNDKKFLDTIYTVINYYVNADMSSSHLDRIAGSSLLKKLDTICEEQKFFESWGAYEKDKPAFFYDDEKRIIRHYIEKAKKDYVNRDVDVTSILNFEDIRYLDSVLEF